MSDSEIGVLNAEFENTSGPERVEIARKLGSLLMPTNPGRGALLLEEAREQALL